jgi:hypothetical protein
MTAAEVFGNVPVGSFLRFSGPLKNGAGKLVAKLPNCLDLEVWSLNGASLVLVLHADEGLDFEIEEPIQSAHIGQRPTPLSLGQACRTALSGSAPE